MEPTTTRRSFMVELMNRAAGAWIILTGLFAGAAVASSCGTPEPAYGGPPMLDAAYGGPPGQDAGRDSSMPGPDAAYGGPPGNDAG